MSGRSFGRAAAGHTYNRAQANKGKPFEDFLLFVHETYQKQGVGVVHKVPTEFIPIRDRAGKIVNVKVERKSCVDYLGRYASIPVAVEAKHTEDDRIRWDRVEPHQADYLDDFCKDPQAVGIVLVSFSLRRFFAVPWQAWKVGRDAWKATPARRRPASVPVRYCGDFWDTPQAASISPGEFPRDWEVRPGGMTGLPYLEIIGRWRDING